eukprot:scaffold15374_cov18-Tisochrysis_lutea.AAC.3
MSPFGSDRIKRLANSIYICICHSRELEKIVPRARKTEVEGVDESFVPPLIAPSVPGRLYFRFGKPIRLTKNLKEDREAADREYANVKVGGHMDVGTPVPWCCRYLRERGCRQGVYPDVKVQDSGRGKVCSSGMGEEAADLEH